MSSNSRKSADIRIIWVIFQNVAAKVDLQDKCLLDVRVRRLSGRNHVLDAPTFESTSMITHLNNVVLLFTSNGCRVFSFDDFSNYFRKMIVIARNTTVTTPKLATRTPIILDEDIEPMQYSSFALAALKDELDIIRLMGYLDLYNEVRNQMYPEDQEDSTFGNRAALKLKEIDDILSICVKGGRFLDIAGAPGGFTLYMRSKGMTGAGISLNKPDTPQSDRWFESLHKDGGFFINNGITGDGDLLNDENMAYWLEHYHRTMDVATADGGFNTDRAGGKQEERSLDLLRAQFILATSSIKTGGSIVIKLFATENRDTAHLLLSYASLFDKRFIIKPISSRRVNSEKYFVGIGLRSHAVKANWVDAINSHLGISQITHLKPVLDSMQLSLTKRGLRLLVLAPSGAGKSTFSHLMVDGDNLVKWPSTPKFWETMSKEDQIKLGVQHLDTVSSEAMSGKIVAFNPNPDALDRYEFDCDVVVWMPTYDTHKRNLISRSLFDKVRPGVEIIDKNRRYLIDYAIKHGIQVFEQDAPAFLATYRTGFKSSRHVSQDEVESAKLILTKPHQTSIDFLSFVNKIKVVVDIGCGDGAILRMIANKYKARVIGIDILEKVEGIEYYHIDNSQNIRDKIADLVIIRQTLHHMNYYQGLTLAKRLLKHNGLLYIRDHNIEYEHELRRVDAMHHVYKDYVSDPAWYLSKQLISDILNGLEMYFEFPTITHTQEKTALKQVTIRMPPGIASIFSANHEVGTRISRVTSLQRYFADMVYNRASKYLVYAFPGSGKTTWINSIVRSTGYKAIDTDDYLKALEEQSDMRKYHEIAFNAATIFNADTPNVIVTNFHSDLLLAYMRKMGFCLIAVKLDDKEWERRFSERKDLQDQGMPWRSWRKEIDYSRFDFVVNDFDEISDMLYVPVQGTSYGNPLSANHVKPLTSHVPLMNDFGHYVRKSVMMFIARRGLIYHGLGDEIESVLDAMELKIDALHSGLPGSEPRDAEGKLALEKIVVENLYDVKLKDGVVYTSLWAISNSGNKGLVSDMSHFAGYNVILMYPNLHTARLMPYGLDNNYVSGTELRTKRGERIYSDVLEDPSSVLRDDRYYVMSMNDFLSYINHNIDGTYVGPKGRFFFSRNNYMCSLWFIVISRELVDHSDLQTWYNTQTQNVRLVSIPIRRYLAVDTDSLHKFRRLALKRVLPEATTIVDTRVNGFTMRNKKKYFIAVSGHMVNLLLYSTNGCVDFARYLDTVAANVRLYHQRGSLPGRLKNLLGKELLAEDNDRKTIRRMWHSYLEFYIAVSTYVLMVRALRLPYNQRAVSYCLKRLAYIKGKYTSFDTDMGWQALDYSKNYP